jgi:protein-S-isoprenylcysteine O-methyltransferase Ste14
VLFNACFGAYFAAFVLDLPVPYVLNGPQTSLPYGAAIAVNVGLMALFAVQHTIMARRGFKRWITSILPQAAERPTFVAASDLCVIALMVFWQPLPETLWAVESEAAYWVMVAIALAGWGFMFYSSFLINHFDLFGLRQGWCYLRGREPAPLTFRTPTVYRMVRHPLQLGLLTFLWVTPHLTEGRLLLNGVLTVYVLIGLWFEERDLIREFGRRYRTYRLHVPKLIPRLIPARPSDLTSDLTSD